MTAGLALPVAARTTHTRHVTRATELVSIGDPAVDLAVWQRPPPVGLATLLDAVPADRLPHARLDAVAPADVAAALRDALAADHAAADPRRPPLAALLADVALLAGLYGRLAERRRIRVRLEAVTGDACRRFHVDRVALRLLCTYRGPATEWLPRPAVRLAADGHIAEPEPNAVRRLARFAVALLKGSAWPGSPGCVHRSPPIAGTGVVRLLLCIDAGMVR